MTKNDVIRMAREAGMFTHKEVPPEILAFANLVAAAEREACAKVVQDHPFWLGNKAKQEITATIRARGTQNEYRFKPEPPKYITVNGIQVP